MVNFRGSRSVVFNHGLSHGNMFLHLVEPVIYAVVEGVMDGSPGFLRLPRWCANDVNDRDPLSVSTCNGVDG